MKKHLILFLLFCTGLFAQEKSPWKRVSVESVSKTERSSDKESDSDKILFELDEAILRKSLDELQKEAIRNTGVKISIPNRSGDLEVFLVKEFSNFSPELQANFPEIRAYRGIGLTDKNASVHFSMSPNGIQTMAFRESNQTEFIERFSKTSSVYEVFNAKNTDRSAKRFSCTTANANSSSIIQLSQRTTRINANNGVFKTLHLALACTGEYTAYFGGETQDAVDAMNSTMTRVNGVLGRDLAVKLLFIPIIYTNPNTDPFSPAEKMETDWSNQLQSVLTSATSTIGNANFDIGHLFGASGGGGNSGCIGCVCENFSKGRAYTSPANGQPEGDAFDIDFVAHEMGHQLGANHTFSHQLEGTTAQVEPGSGTTIMGYAGITNYNIQNNSDAYFSYASVSQIQTNLASKSCPVNTSMLNQTPSVNAGVNRTIPKGTAFFLKGTATDPNGNSLTYCWEQMDSATASTAANSVTYPTKPDGALFRSLPPSASSIRFFPAFNRVLSNTLYSTWESVSDVSRNLHFTLTVRNNALQTNSSNIIVTVDGNKGPFKITSQDKSDIAWLSGNEETITWDVNNTNTLSGATSVNIKLSTDGGLTFSTVLKENTPNDGTETITVPSGIVSKDCRILIEPTENIFYAINSTSFSIGYFGISTCNTYPFSGEEVTIPESSTFATKTATIPENTDSISNIKISVNFSHASLSDVSIQLTSPEGKVVKLYDQNCNTVSGNLSLSFDDLGSLISCNSKIQQTIVPSEPLTNFNNQNPSGTWTLKFRDSFVGNSGTLTSAALSVCTKKYLNPLENATVISDTSSANPILYPNPSKGSFNLIFSSTSTSQITILIHDMNGMKVYESQFQSAVPITTKSVELNNAQAGVYFLTIIDGSIKKSKKILIY